MKKGRDRRERRARLLGVVVALAVMLVAGLTLGWPAPGLAVALGLGVYLLARGPAKEPTEQG